MTGWPLTEGNDGDCNERRCIRHSKHTASHTPASRVSHFTADLPCEKFLGFIRTAGMEFLRYFEVVPRWCLRLLAVGRAVGLTKYPMWERST